jgi:biotin-dependent carboxylase-like uncharacterized protein
MMIETFIVLSPGPYMTVQDAGRYGYQHMGIPISGVLDAIAHRTANLLVGNPEDAAVFEITLIGPQLAVLREADIAVTGAEIEVKLNYSPVECWKTIRVVPGDVLHLHQVTSGCRGYLAVNGGVAVPEVMGSRSTYASGKLGGYRGRPIQKGDIISRGEGPLLEAPRHMPKAYIPRYTEEFVLRAIPGPQDDFFDTGLETLFGSAYTVSANADRMGYRLQGDPIEHRPDVPKSIISEPSMPGSIQVPADLQPIILLVEQTVGGYTKIATVISSDLPKVAQAIPGNTIRFERVTLDQAHQIYHDQERRLGEIAHAIEASAH